MSFQPVAPFSGYAGWKFLERTRDAQQEVFQQSIPLKRDTDYFRENIGSITNAEDLVADRRLLSVALGAFGLGDDIGNKYFIKKVLSDDISQDEALANRLADKRYLAMSKAFGFGDSANMSTGMSDFPDKIISAFQDQQFEIAIGEQDENLRLSLGVERELTNILSKDTTSDGFWFLALGTPTLQSVFVQALGLPSSISGLDLDRQVEEFREKSERIFGNGEVSHFADPEVQEALIRRFLVLSEVNASVAATSSASVALTLLQNSAF